MAGGRTDTEQARLVGELPQWSPGLMAGGRVPQWDTTRAMPSCRNGAPA